MNRTNFRTLGLFGLTLATTISTGCGDPCLDDGRGKPGAVCEQDGADGNETGTTDGTGTGTDDADDAEAGSESAETSGGDIWCTDDDMDGYGDPEECEEIPAGEDPPAGSVPEAMATDCDDEDANTFPGAAELDDPADACMTDADDDGWGDETPSNPNAVPGSDCNDDNVNAFPGAAENEDPPDACMEDDDMDGWGDSEPSGSGSTIPGLDCDDAVFNMEACVLWCEDLDMDGYGNPEVCVVLPAEEAPEGYVEDNTDCLDTDANAFPGAAENDDPDACMLDADHDGWGDTDPPEGVAPGRDCDDADEGRVVCVDASPGCVDTSQGLEAPLMSVATGGDGNYVFAWTPVETLDDPSLQNPTATPDEITTYTVTATDGAMNMDSDEITVHLTDKAWVLGGQDAECEAVGFLGAPADHSVSVDGEQVCTTSNSDPTAYICPIVHQETRITGTMVVTDDDNDDDIVGFVWGWQDTNQFYMLQWKKTYQNWFGCEGLAGMTVRKFDAVGAFENADFACETDTANQTVLLSPDDIYDAGWVEGTEYGVEILYDLTQTEITITDLSDNSEVTSFVVLDDSYPSGKFGTYDFSQKNACNGPWQSSCL
ncbi:hypothetical protein ENSA5_53890 [Enhygromyxa salina]|uniref:TSP C-terminal domain-containing protein n=1 Tax=Enhygromyxa salina TaxID=215803 RepID=A0A2S9XFJ1_9BACT|nr:hypothetical protein [Enhygromyxa salina]PRP91629.1 hypothetical protein ENSA5_53890 [Enhygromyxa salina]